MSDDHDPTEKRRPADDVALDMDRRLHELEERLRKIERRLEEPVEQPLQRFGGDQEARHGEPEH